MSDTNISPTTSATHLEAEATTLANGKSESPVATDQIAASNSTHKPADTTTAFLQLVKKHLRNASEYSLDQISIQLNSRIEWHSSPARYAIRAGKRAAIVSIHLNETNTNGSNDIFQRFVDNIITIYNALEHGVRLNNHRLHVTVTYKDALNTLTAAEANDAAANVARTYMQLRAATAPYL